jgi:death-on-curing protein
MRPDVDQGEQAMVAIASHDVDEAWMAAWLRERMHFDAD